MRLLSQYFWLNLTLFATTVLYIPLFFSIRGNIDVIPYGSRWYHYKVRFGPKDPRSSAMPNTTSLEWMEDPGVAGEIRSAATKMLWYPVAYAITALPADVIRWAVLQKIDPTIPVKDIPFTTIAVFWSLFNISGVVNVVLFTLTRPRILLFRDRYGGENHPSRSEQGLPAPEGYSVKSAQARGAVVRDDLYKGESAGSDESLNLAEDVIELDIARSPASHMHTSSLEGWTEGRHSHIPLALSLANQVTRTTESGAVLPQKPSPAFSKGRQRSSRVPPREGEDELR